MDKNSFITQLCSMSKEEINKFIQEKGKTPRIVKAFSYPKYIKAFIYLN